MAGVEDRSDALGEHVAGDVVARTAGPKNRSLSDTVWLVSVLSRVRDP